VRNLHFRLLVAAAISVLALGCQKKRAEETSSSSSSPAADKFEWLTDFKRAQQEAKTRNRPLLIQFTGSDWCPPCIQMQKEILDTPEFRSYAAKNFILLELDYPRGKTQPPELAAQNRELAQKFMVEGFPCILVLGSDGTPRAQRTGYGSGEGTVTFIAWLEKWKG
jgi:thioredoxin-related protein